MQIGPSAPATGCGFRAVHLSSSWTALNAFALSTMDEDSTHGASISSKFKYLLRIVLTAYKI